MKSKKTVAVGALLCLLAACGTDDSPGGDTSGDTSVQEQAVTWHNSVAPIVAAHCASCHRDGGSGPTDLTDPDVAIAHSAGMLAAVEAGIMPPWPPAQDCHPIADPRVLPADELELLRAWVDAGAPLGDPATAAELPALPGPAFEPDLVLPMPEPYLPNQELTDDWRCFVLEGTFDAETFVRAAEVQPGSSQVHHVLIYAVTATAAETILAADAAEAGPGYTCFGGPNPAGADTEPGASGFSATGFPTQLGAWVPGIVPRVLPDGTAFRVAAGSRIVMQVHYNTLNTSSNKHVDGEPEPDQSSLRLLLADEAPEMLVRTVPIADPSIVIPAGDPASTHVRTVPNVSGKDIVITTAAGHMHTLGTELRARVVRADGASDCVLDIGAWDFNWQMFYQFPEDNPVVVRPGDALELTCVYDNSAANQPLVDGERQAPREVTWGESTLDEMCLLYISTISPYEPAPEPDPTATGACAGVSPCLPDCDATDATCLLGCESVTTECVSCVVRGSATCGGAACALQFQTSRDCLTTCGLSMISLDGTFGDCLQATCPDTYAAATACFDPILATDACQPVLEGCGVFAE